MCNNQLLLQYTIIFLATVKALQFFSYVESGATFLNVGLVANNGLFGKGIIFNPTDHRKTCGKETAVKSLKNYTNWKTSRITHTNF